MYSRSPCVVSDGIMMPSSITIMPSVTPSTCALVFLHYLEQCSHHPTSIRLIGNNPSPSTISSQSIFSLDTAIMPTKRKRPPRPRCSTRNDGNEPRPNDSVLASELLNGDDGARDEDGVTGEADSSDEEGDFGDDGLYDDDEEEEDEPVAEVVEDEDDAAAVNRVEAVPSLSVIWDSEKVKKLPDGQWKCLHCVPPAIFSGHNATKCLYHLTKTKGKNIRVCNGNIDAGYQKQYNDLKIRHYEKTGRLLSHKTEIDQRISDSQNEIARAVPNKKYIPNKKKKAIQHNMNDFCDLTTLPQPKRLQSSATSITSATTSSLSSKQKIPRGRHQLKLGPNMSNPQLTVKLFCVLFLFHEWLF